MDAQFQFMGEQSKMKYVGVEYDLNWFGLICVAVANLLIHLPISFIDCKRGHMRMNTLEFRARKNNYCFIYNYFCFD